MKLKAIIGCILVVAMLAVASPVLALSIGVSPTHVELEVPSNGSATADVKIHYFSGDVKISLIDIPLRVEPETIHVDASSEPVPIELTVYGDESLGSRVYDGYVRFIAVSGGAATGGVQVIARVTNVVEGETPVLAEEEIVLEEAAVPEEEAEVEVEESAQSLPEEMVEEMVEETASAPGPPEPAAAAPSVALPVAGIFAGAAVVITLIVVLVRRRGY